jgi:hypothetical protein
MGASSAFNANEIQLANIRDTLAQTNERNVLNQQRIQQLMMNQRKMDQADILSRVFSEKMNPVPVQGANTAPMGMASADTQPGAAAGTPQAQQIPLGMQPDTSATAEARRTISQLQRQAQSLSEVAADPRIDPAHAIELNKQSNELREKIALNTGKLVDEQRKSLDYVAGMAGAVDRKNPETLGSSFASIKDMNPTAASFLRQRMDMGPGDVPLQTERNYKAMDWARDAMTKRSEQLVAGSREVWQEISLLKERDRVAQNNIRNSQRDADIARRDADSAWKHAGGAVKGAGSGSGGGDAPGGVGAELLQDRDTGKKFSLNKRTGKAFVLDDEGHWTPISANDVPANAVKPGTGGAQQAGREAVFTQRVITSANQASKDLANIVQLPLSSSTGVFGGRKQGVGLFDATKEVLANKVTQQEAQTYSVMATGVQRTLATIEAVGLMPTNYLTHQMDAVVWKEGDTQLTKLHKLAQTRQIVQAGIESIEANPRVSAMEKGLALKILDSMSKAVPFTHTDLIKLTNAQAKNPQITLRDLLPKVKKDASGGVGPASTPSAEASPSTTPSKDYSSLWE